MTWAHMIDGLAAGQPLSENEAETLFAAVFDRGVPDLELGGLLALLEQRRMSSQELAGVLAALSTRVFQIAVPDTQWRPVVMPGYGVSIEQPNLLPLLAISLQRLGIPVLAHGMLSDEHGVASAYIFRELDIMPCASLAQAQQELRPGILPLCRRVRWRRRWPICWRCVCALAAAHWRACWRGWPIPSAAARCS